MGESAQLLRVCRCLYDLAGELARWYSPVSPAALPGRELLAKTSSGR